MIFSPNATMLGASVIPMAEGYDCSFGAAQALVESARNDYAMFKAMIAADYKEMQIQNESTGVLAEGQIDSLHEAVGGGIFAKIAELFTKLVEKVKAIAHSFITKIAGFIMKDKQLVKKYKDEVIHKNGIGNLEIKWRNRKGGEITSSGVITEKTDLESFAGDWVENEEDRYKKYTFEGCEFSEIETTMREHFFDEEDEVQVKTLPNSINTIVAYIEKYDIKKFKSSLDKLTSKAESLVKQAKAKAKDPKDDATDQEKNDAKKASNIYDCAKAYQDVVVREVGVLVNLKKMEYKQYKAAFVKAIAANPKKLTESATYLDAVAEAAEQEVDDVIDNALTDEEISAISAASKDVKDDDVCDCPNAITYGPDQYADNADPAVTGTVDTDINSKEEAAFFGELVFK